MRELHLVTPLASAIGGSEQRALTLYRLLLRDGGVTPRLWSPVPVPPALAAQWPITEIDPARGVHPRGGTLVFVGLYFDYGHWLAAAQAERLLVVANTNNPAAWARNRQRLASAGLPAYEVLYTGARLQQSLGGEGRVLPSLIELEHFTPQPRAPATPFTVGRHSRDESFKHHPEDVIVYQDVLQQGGAVTLMGASAVAALCRPHPALHVLPAGALDPARFLQGLDVFVYRTDPAWFEVFGRVVHEAMACGLPVLCHHEVGGAQFIEHGVNGLVFRTTGEALHALDVLRANAPLRAALGAAARERMLALHGGTLRQQTLECLLT